MSGTNEVWSWLQFLRCSESVDPLLCCWYCFAVSDDSEYGSADQVMCVRLWLFCTLWNLAAVVLAISEGNVVVQGHYFIW